MRKRFSIALFVAVACSAVRAAFGGGLVGEDYPAFEKLFPNNRMLSGASYKPAESCVTFLCDDWKGIACFRDGVCAVFLLFPTEETGVKEEQIARQLEAWRPGLAWLKRDGQKLCQDDMCHGGLFPEGRGAFLIWNEAQRQIKSRRIQGKDLFAQSMTTAILRLGEPLDCDNGVLIWETSQLRIGVPMVSSAMSYLVWTPTRQKKLRDKKALRMAKDIVSVEFETPSNGPRAAHYGDLIGYGGGYRYCLIRNEQADYSYTICTSALRYADLNEMADRRIYPSPVKKKPAVSTDRLKPHKTPAPATPSPTPAPAAEKTPPPPEPAKAPTHEELLKLFTDSLEMD